jgi:hypothetical protein
MHNCYATLADYLVLRADSVLVERQLTDKSDLPSSLQTAMENRPKLARTTSTTWETAGSSEEHSIFKSSPSQA